jgi:hypothetical protein
MSDTSNRTSSALANLLLLAFSALITLAVAEGILRLTNYSFANVHPKDPILGYRMLPNMSGWIRGETSIVINTNSHGMRDREYSLSKPRNIFRIALLGDSYAAALQVEEGQMFSRYVERGLNQCNSFGSRYTDIQVLNFGVSGFGTAQQLLMFRNTVRQFNVDMVILAFLPANDFTDNHPALRGNNAVPYFHFTGDQLVLGPAFQKSNRFGFNASFIREIYYSLLPHSRLVQLVAEKRWKFIRRRRINKLAAQDEEEMLRVQEVRDAGFEVGCRLSFLRHR